VDNAGIALTSVAGNEATVRLNGDGTLTYSDPAGVFAGLGPGQTVTDSFTYLAQDGEGGFARATVTVTVTGVATGGEDDEPAFPPSFNLWRLFNTDTGGHFFTFNRIERDVVLEDLSQYRLEPNTFEVIAPSRAAGDSEGTEPGSSGGEAGTGVLASDKDGEVEAVYRFFNTETGGHFYTLSEAERDFVIDTLPSYRFEGVGFGAYNDPDDRSGLVPVFRFFNTETGGHFYTASEEERDFVLEELPSYRFEDIGFYALPEQTSSGRAVDFGGDALM
jgi:VCBS repeat-containing protein